MRYELTRRGLRLVGRRCARAAPTVAAVARIARELGIDPIGLGGVRELHRGALVELEHSPDPVVAVQIAADHLGERRDYYVMLAV
jgi:pseudouridine-5'-phosphate glycosidase